MTDAQWLAIIRFVHTAIYIIMAIACFVLLYAGITGQSGWWLWVALILVGIETVVFVGSGLKCPLTALAVRYGAATGHVFDTFLPERATRHTFRFFGTVMIAGVALLGARWAGWL